MMPEYEKYIDLQTIPDDAISYLREFTLSRILPEAPAFGQWLHSWLDTEQFFRQTDPAKRPKNHMLCIPPVQDWNNEQLGRALSAVTMLSYMIPFESLGVIVDRLVLCVSQCAAERLIKND
jgi:hypothetical protein